MFKDKKGNVGSGEPIGYNLRNLTGPSSRTINPKQIIKPALETEIEQAIIDGLRDYGPELIPILLL